MPSHVVLRAGASRRAVIGAATLLVAGAGINEPAFAHPGGGQGAHGPSPHSALAPGHAQDPPGRRAHGNPPHPVSSHGNHAGAVDASPAPRKHAVKRPAAITQQAAPPQNGHHKTTICHATGSATNPYVEISIPPPAVSAHSRHQDGRDIIPAPASGCPGATAGSSSTATEPGATATTRTPPDAGSQTAATVVPSVPVTSPSERTAPALHSVLGVEASSGGRSVAPARLRGGALPASRDDGGGLPFTGFAAALAAALGIALVAAGAGVRRATRA